MEPKSITPKQNFFLGKALEFRNNPISFVFQMAKEHPKICRFRFAHLPMVLLTDAEGTKHVLQTNAKNYQKGIEYEHLKPVLGEGLLTSEGEFWFRQRRLAQPAFHKEKILRFHQQMVDYTSLLMEQWKNKETIDVHSEMMHLALQIVSSTLLSYKITSEVNEVENALEIAINESYNRIQRLMNWPLWFPVPRNLKYNQSRKILDRIIHGIIEKRRNSKEEYHDLLEMLMSAQDEDTGESMSDKHLRDEVMTIFLAGHETTANALTWAFYLLAKHDDKRKKYFDEIDSVLGKRTPEMEDLRKMEFLNQIIHESLRLYPPAWILGRTALAEDEILGHKINKGDNIMISPYQIHRDPNFWDNPNDFIPERFTPEMLKDLHKFQYFPFGGGPRFCIGNNFAIQEMQVILAIAGQHFELLRENKKSVELDPVITLRPKGGMKIKLTKRI